MAQIRSMTTPSSTRPPPHLITHYIVSTHSVPVPPDALESAIRARGVWRETAVEPPADRLWSRLALLQGPFEVRVAFTVGDALPPAVREWLAWGAAALSPEALGCVEAPAATLRVESRLHEGGERLLGVQEPRSPTETAALKDLPRRAAHFAAAVAAEIVRVSGGVLVDVPAQRFWEAERAEVFTQGGFDVRNFVSVHADATDDGFHLHTHGMARFGRADLEIAHVPREALSFGTHVLNEVAHHQALGNVVRNGETVVVDEAYAFALSATSRNGAHVGNDVLALVDPVDAARRDTYVPREPLGRFCEDVADDLLREADLDGALRWLSSSVNVAPHRPSAWRKRAGVLAHLGRKGASDADLAEATALESHI